MPFLTRKAFSVFNLIAFGVNNFCARSHLQLACTRFSSRLQHESVHVVAKGAELEIIFDLIESHTPFLGAGCMALIILK